MTHMDMKTYLFRDERHKRRLHIRPYQRVVALVRGHKPKVLPADVFGSEDPVLSMEPIDPTIEHEFPAALLVVDAMYIKHFADWEIESTAAMLDYLMQGGSGGTLQ